MGGWLGIGGSGVKTDRKQQLTGYGDLNNIFNFGMTSGRGEIGAGNQTEAKALEDVGPSSDYYKKLLSGNRTATLQAVAPTVNAANAQEDAAKRGLATSGTARGGGSTSAVESMDTAKQATIDNAITATKPTAAEGELGVAKTEAGVGATQLTAAMNLLGLGSNAATNLTDISSKSRELSNQLNLQTQEQAGQLAGALLYGF